MSQIKLLLVDDSPVFAQTAKAFLAADARLHVLEVASTGADALDRIPSERPHVVLMDLHMPVMNGLEATRQIKSLDAPPKVIVVSLDDTPQNRCGALAAGADGFLAKSRFVAELTNLIERLAGMNAASTMQR